MTVVALDRKAGINPVLLTLGVVTHIGVTQRRQFTGGVLRSISRRTGAIDDNFCRFVREKRWRKLLHLVRRQVNCAGQVRLVISNCGQSLNKQKLVAAIDLHPQFGSGNCSYHPALHRF